MADVVCYVALGGNQGDVLSTFRLALPKLGKVLAVASAYRTRALTLPGSEPQGDYWNSVAKVQTSLRPREYLGHLLAIEASLGRVRRQRWDPRPIDLDLLLYGDVRINEPGLTLPHPEIATRAFVLAPLVEVAPDLEIAGLGPVKALWGACAGKDAVLETVGAW